MARSQSKKLLRKRDFLLWIIVLLIVFALVFGVSELIEHTTKNRRRDQAGITPHEYTTSPEYGADVPVMADASLPDELGEDIPPAVTLKPQSDEEQASAIEREGSYNDDIKTIVLIGVDRQELEESAWYRTGGQSDVILLVSINEKAKEFFIVSVNRDVVTEIEAYAANGGSYGTVEEQIEFAYAYGDGGRSSGNNVIKSLHALIGNDVPFLGYIASPIPIVTKLADAVGGVEVTIEDDFTGVDDTLITGETVLLTGEHAENFVRARMRMPDSTTNSSRMSRQIAFMTSFINKARSEMTANELVELYADVLDMCVTDMRNSEITKWILTAYDYQFKGFYRIDGIDEVRIHDARALYPDEEAINELIGELYFS